MRRKTLTDRLERIAAGYAYAGLAVEFGTDPEAAPGCGGSGPTELAWYAAPEVAASREALFRVASISKIVTGQIFAEAAMQSGASPPFATPVAEVLPWFPGPATLGQLASHTGGVSDGNGYVIPPGETLADFVTTHADRIFTSSPVHFAYSNLGYIILAALIERWTGRRFDHLASDWLSARGIPGGFNWSGVAERHLALPTCRRTARGFMPQIDQDLAEKGVLGPDGRARNLSGYRPGDNPALFSPQGGLRTSLAGLLTLARYLPDMEATVLHRGSPHRGSPHDPDAVFESYGAGLQIFDAPAFYPHPLSGHFAGAYGFRGGVWYDRVRDIAFAYALNGLEEGDDSDAFSTAELNIFATVAEWEG